MSENLKAKLLAIRTEFGKVHKNAEHKDANGKVRFTYATLSEIFVKLNSLLDKHKVLMNTSITLNSELSGITNKLIYHGLIEFQSIEENDFKEYYFNFPSDTQQKNDIQAFGSTMTYAQRYMLGAIFGIAFDDEDPDNDKNTVKNEPKQTTYKSNNENVSIGNVISEAQQKRIWGIAKGKGVATDTVIAIVKKYGYGSTKEIKFTDYDKICKEVENA